MGAVTGFTKSINMKIEYWESEHGLDISMTPESPKEVSQLARYALNAKAVKPEIFLDFSSDTPQMRLWMKKNTSATVKSIKPGMK